MTRMLSPRTLVSAIALTFGLVGTLALWAQAPNQGVTKTVAATKSGTPSSQKQPVVLVPLKLMEELIRRPEVIAELGLSDSQANDIVHRIQSATLEYQRAVRPSPGVRKPNAPSIQSVVIAIQNQAAEDVEKLMSPDQARRFRQLVVQRKYPGPGLQVYLSDDFEDGLHYTDKQREAIRDELLAVDREVKEAVAKIIQDGRNRIENRLSAEQRAKSQDLVGSRFEFKKETELEGRERIRDSLKR